LKKTKSITSLLSSEKADGEADDGVDLASMEVTETGEYLLSIPESVEPDENVRETLHDSYLDANEIVFGDEDEVFEQPGKKAGPIKVTKAGW
jgi:hypothetical protein